MMKLFKFFKGIFQSSKPAMEPVVQEIVDPPQVTEPEIQSPKEYALVETTSKDFDATQFMVECNKMLSEGWKAQGGVYVIQRGMMHTYFQAFVK